MQAVSDADVNALTDQYYAEYDIITDGRDVAESRAHVAEQAKSKSASVASLRRTTIGPSSQPSRCSQG